VATHDYVIANGTGAAVRSDLNNALAAIVSLNSSASAPATTYAYMLWADTTAGIMKMRNGANSAWISLWELDGTFIATDISLSAGTAGAPSLYFTGDTNTGIYSPGADQVAVSTGGTGRLFVDASGRVGLGNSSPGSYNASSDDLVVGDHTGAHGVTICSQNNSSGYIMFADGTTGAQAYAGQITYDHTNNRLTLGTNDGTTGLTVDSSQRVGIGTTSPATALHVEVASGSASIRAQGPSGSNYFGFAGSTHITQLQSASTQTFLNCVANVPLLFGTNDTERARIDSSGRLLVGTSSTSYGSSGSIVNRTNGTSNPGNSFRGGGWTMFSIGGEPALVLSSNVNAAGAVTSAETARGGIGFEYISGSEPTRMVIGIVGTPTVASALTFWNESERMRITQAGAVLFNRTSSGLAIPGAGFIANTGGAYGEIVQSNNGVACLYLSQGFGSGTQTAVDLRFNSTQVGTINVSSSATSYNTSSDYRLKENVVSLIGAIDRVNQLQVHRFNFIADPATTVDGFIAHEAQAVVPECVTGTKDAVDAGGNPQYQGIDQSKLVPLLTAALQEAIAEIASLKDRVAALEGA